MQQKMAKNAKNCRLTEISSKLENFFAKKERLSSVLREIGKPIRSTSYELFKSLQRTFSITFSINCFYQISGLENVSQLRATSI